MHLAGCPLADDVASLLAEIGQLAAVEPEPLSLAEKVMGYSRSYLAGPTFNFADNIEAAVAAPFTDLTYDQELAQIRAEQGRFKEQTDYLDNATEIASGAVLNPLSWLQRAKTAATVAPTLAKVPFLPTTLTVATSAPGQAALAGAGAADGEDVLENTLKSAAVGTGFSALASSLGAVSTSAARNADRLKLSAYDIGTGDLQKQLRKMGDSAASLPTASDIPIVSALNKAESQGLISVGNDLLENARGIKGKQDILANDIVNVVGTADSVVPPDKNYAWTNTIKFIDSLSGNAKEQAESAAMREFLAIEKQLGSGRLKDLQRAKVGLNYKHDKNPYTEDIVKTIRQDLKETIEGRIDAEVAKGKLPQSLSGAIKGLNREWGSLEDLRQTFVKKAYKDIQGDPVEDVFASQRTSGGAGVPILAASNTGSIIPLALGALQTAARTDEAKSAIADVLRDPGVSKLASAVGSALPEVVTGRNVSQAFNAVTQPGQSESPEADSVESLLAEIQSLAAAESGGDQGSRSSAQFRALSGPGMPTATAPKGVSAPAERSSVGGKQESPSLQAAPVSAPNQYAFMGKLFKAEKAKAIPADVLQKIKADPIDHAVMLMESGGDPGAKNPDSTASGLFQLVKKTAGALGVKDVFDAEENYEGYRKLRADTADTTGNKPELVYAAHYLGETLLRKVLDGKPITATEQKRVETLQNVLLPRFRKIYEQVAV